MKVFYPSVALMLLFSVSYSTVLYAENSVQTLNVESFTSPIEVDGDPSDWPELPASPGHSGQPVKPAMRTFASYLTSPDEKDFNKDWEPNPTIRAAVFEQTLYLLVSWQDESADIIYRPWTRIGSRWNRGRKKDDMLSIRFEMTGELDACMLSDTTYSVDLWRWSAGRSNQQGYADDMSHHYSPNFMPEAVVYPYYDRKVYIVSRPDQGTPGWEQMSRPSSKEEVLLPGISYQPALGSVADVKAKGVWKDGQWTVELSRPLQTADQDDVVFAKGGVVNAQLAFFNAGYRLRKQITSRLQFNFESIQ